MDTAGPQIAPAGRGRIASLDQFRGYTVVGMLFVNFIGGFAVMPAVLKHHNTYCSYADTIMPQFFFAVGFAFRLTFLRRFETIGYRAAAISAIKRNLGLLLVGFVFHHLDGDYKKWSDLEKLGLGGFFATAFSREIFQTLVHIALASIWVLPVIARGPMVRVAYLVASALLHLGLSYGFYFDFAWKRPVIDGGPLGFLSWSIPVLVGSLAYDIVVSAKGHAVARLAAWSIVLMGLGYALSCMDGSLASPPFFPPSRPIDLWTMSQRTGSISYLIFSAGFSLAVYAIFVVLCDRAGLQAGIFRTFGQNALVTYLLHGMIGGAIKPFVPNDSPLWYVGAAVGLYFLINYLFIRSLERDGIHLRL
ncbi:hypothetical protein [Singulisphaera sp. PoT]|uniref:hypothetical protein n=1 Tax=Singulisphaera sp. PoT TaxID=3411797 RepID=UPI003BF482F9